MSKHEHTSELEHIYKYGKLLMGTSRNYTNTTTFHVKSTLINLLQYGLIVNQLKLEKPIGRDKTSTILRWLAPHDFVRQMESSRPKGVDKNLR